MINPISFGNIKTGIFYINDFHGKSINMEHTMSASHTFDAQNMNKDIDILKLSSGDIMIGEDVNINKASVIFENSIGIQASAVGNHEHDIQNKSAEVLPDIKFNMLSNNVKINPRNPWSRILKSSVVQEVNGHKYGIIGTSPIDLFTRIKYGPIQEDMTVDNAQETIKDIQIEIDKLKAQGINKIILLSHLGNALEKLAATQTSGLDVILGGHSHNLIKDVKEGENLLYGKDGNPVIITQAGKDGKNFGILNLEFDDNGIIKKVQNNIGYTKKFHRNMALEYIYNKIFKNNKIYGEIEFAPEEPDDLLIAPNPHGYFIADCMKKDLDADIALIQSANMRGYFEKGEVNDRILNDILPFKNELYKVKYSEKDITDAIRFSCESSFTSPSHKPGMFYISGLKYTISPNGKLLSLSFIDKNGKENSIDINNPRKDKFYTTVINDYCAQGNDKFTMLNRPQQIIEKTGIDSSVCVANVLKKTKKPVSIVDDGRIQIKN